MTMEGVVPPAHLLLLPFAPCLVVTAIADATSTRWAFLQLSEKRGLIEDVVVPTRGCQFSHAMQSVVETTTNL